MSLKSTLKRLSRAAPAMLSHLPALIAAAAEVRQALRKEKKDAAAGPEAASASAPGATAG